MLFLLNDKVVEFQLAADIAPELAGRVSQLTKDKVIRLVCEVMAADPSFPQTPAAGMRAAILLTLKAPELNAALLIAPRQGCDPAEVGARFAAVGPNVLFQMKALQDQGELNAGVVNAYVWNPVRQAA